MKNAPILVATDLTARADRAIDRAIMLGTQLKRDVAIVHAQKSGEQQADDDTEKLVRAVLPDPDADLEILLPIGTPPEEIAAAANDKNAAILCVGPACYNAIGDFFLGNAVDYIARYCLAPVLVVKNRAHKPYDTIVFATDFSDCSRDALMIAAKLFPDATIHLVHAYQVPFQSWQKAAYVREEIEEWAQESLKEFMASLIKLPELDGRVTGSVVYGTALSAVASEAEQAGTALAAFGSHGESGFRHATIGSVANELLNTLKIDSLIIKPEQR